jgi:acyl transferase domain-containing protein
MTKLLDEELDTKRAPEREPIAIVGIGCRFPGSAHDPDRFWRVVREGRDVVDAIPLDRFDARPLLDTRPGTPGKLVSPAGGFLDGIDKFDAGFFGISPREAADMDPRQRLLLEVAWEALEDAAIVPGGLQGTPTGVFLGLQSDGQSRARSSDLGALVGGGLDAAAGRLSYAFGFEGPSLVVKTDRSSSLVAVHLACRSLRDEECLLALAGGANLILTPETSLAFSGASMLALDGRCKFADARADGFVRSEGVGIVVLKRLSRAQRDGDRLHAVIFGSAMNHTGRSGGDLMTPSQRTQEALLRAAYRDADVDPADVAYVEAHGPGTPVGDPIELRAIGAVIGARRSNDRPVLVGSVKTNIGHAEAAAGIAGLVKVVLALQHGTIPESLHHEQPHPDVAFDELHLAVPRAATAWPAGSRPAMAGVSSFGLTGTSAHIVVGAVPGPELASEARPRAELVVLSAKTRPALGALVKSWTAWLEDRGEDAGALADIAATAAARRTHHARRAAIVASSHAELVRGFEALARGDEMPAVSTGMTLADDERRVVFVCPGQGSQWSGMGRQLLAEEPAFREAIADCDVALRPYLGRSLLVQLEQGAPLREIDLVQPVLFAMSVGLAALWRSWGVEPAAVVGTSMGEVAAAHLAGVLSLDDAARVVCHRSRLLKRVSGRGGMGVVGLALDETRALLADEEAALSIAASNSPRSTVIAGDPVALERVLEAVKAQGRFARAIKVDVASHSPQVDPLREDLLAALATVTPRPASVPIFSTVDVRELSGPECGAEYWWRNLRQPVLLSRAAGTLIAGGRSVFVELSPHPILWDALLDCVHQAGGRGVVVRSLHRGDDERAALLESAGQLFTIGQPLSWDRILASGRRAVRIPTYAWDHTVLGHRPDLSTALEPTSDLSKAIASAGPAERRQMIADLVDRHLRRILGIGAGAPVDRARAFRELGLTSLMSVELRNALGRALGRTYSSTLLFLYPTIDSLSEHLSAELGGAASSVESAAAPLARADAVSDRVAALSDRDVTDLLVQRLQRLQPLKE